MELGEKEAGMLQGWTCGHRNWKGGEAGRRGRVQCKLPNTLEVSFQCFWCKRFVTGLCMHVGASQYNFF